MKTQKTTLGVILLLTVMFSSQLFGQQAVIQCHPPEKPICVKAIGECTPGTGGDSVTITWDHKNRGDLVRFELEKFISGSWKEIAEPLPNSSKYIDNNVQEGEKYYYRIRAVNKYKKSEYVNTSAEVPVCKEPPPELDCKIDEDNVLEYFNAHVLQYWDEEKGKYMYYVELHWVVNGGSRDGIWELLRTVYKRKEVAEEPNWNHVFKVKPGSQFIGGEREYYFEDYAVSRSKDIYFKLRWRCGPCREWKDFGPIKVEIPKR